MPKLSPNDPLVASLPDELGTDDEYPDIDEWVQSVGSLPIFQTSIKDDIAYQSGVIFEKAGQIGLSQIVSRVGVSSLQAFTQIGQALGEDVVQEMDQAIAGAETAVAEALSEDNGVLDAGLNAGIGLAVNLSSTVPVVGWIVKLAWSIGMAIRNIVEVVRASKQQDSPPLYPATSFEPSFDRKQLNDYVLKRMRLQKDWTDMFLPPGGGIPAHEAWLGEFFESDIVKSAGGEMKGVRVSATVPCGQCLGYVPGTAFLHQNVEAFSIDVKDTGNVYMPSARQHGLWIWKHISRANSPALYTINADQVAVRWGNYLRAFRMFIEGASKLSPDQKDKIINYYNVQAGGNIFGWGKPRTHTGGVWIPDKDVEKYSPVVEADILRQRQLSFLDTLTVAYVGPNYGALADGSVKSKWEQRRKDLLQHPAICQVDLDMIPDAVYRGQVEYEQQHAGAKCLLGPQAIALQTVKPPPVGQGGAAGVDGFATPPKKKGRSTGNKIAMAAGVALVATGAVVGGKYLLERRRRRA